MPKSTNKVNPLSWNVPIVTSDGTPTNEFQRKWLQQAKTNTDIIPLNTPEEVSAVLDVIEDVPTSIIVRGTTLWEGWTPTASSIIVTNASGALSATVMPADATKFLNGAVPSAFAQVKDSDLSLSDITTNNVSITKHGFAPKAPNDATKFLDGTGAYSTPAGGSVGANPTATAKDTAVNGVATTFMRSDAAPAVQKASSSLFGLVKVDGTTITASGGVISAVGGTPALTNTHIFVGNGSNVATDVAMSGDATIANTGAVTVAKSTATGFNVQHYANIGSLSAPVNTADGDITGLREFIGDGSYSVSGTAPTLAGFSHHPTDLSATDFALVVDVSGAPDSGGAGVMRAMNFGIEATGTRNASNINGVVGSARWTSSGTITVVAGASIDARLTGTGTIGRLDGINAVILGSAAGTITKGNTLYARSPSLTGSAAATTIAGVQIDAQKTTGVTKGYGVNQVGTSDLNVLAGSTAIGTTSDPGTSCVLDIVSTTGTVCIPRMTTTQRLALTPSNGMMVYDTTQGVFQAYGNGAWAPMIGGGGSGGGNAWAVPGVIAYSPDVGAFATLTNAFVPAVTFTVDRIMAAVSNATIGNIYSAFIATINISTGAITGTVVTASARITTTATGQQTLVFTIPVTPLTAGTAYIFAVVITSGTGTTACGALAGSSNGYSSLPIDAAKMQALGAQTKRFWYAQNSDAPGSGSPSSTANTNNYFIGVRAQL